MNPVRWLSPCDYAVSRAIFLRGLGVVYLIAIVSWWVQAPALVGERGLTPMRGFLELAGEVLASRGESRLGNLPTLFWVADGDRALHTVCAAGSFCALAAAAGFLAGPALAGCWCAYLSLVVTGGVFMNFQWDNLLLEAGALGMLLAPWRTVRLPLRRPPPLGWGERAALWLAWLLVGKLMFFSGWTKLAWEDPVWWPERTALTFHYFTQPIPAWTSWWVHQLPPWFHRLSVWLMFGVELALPFALFAGSRLRLVAAVGFAGLMAVVLLTGNYTFFNWLTIILCVLLVADRFWTTPALELRRLRGDRRPAGRHVAETPTADVFRSRSSRPSLAWNIAGTLARVPALAVLILLNAAVVLDDLGPQSGAPDPLLARDRTPEWMDTLRGTFAPFHLVNGYGLFRTMTTERPEIVIEGSRDGVAWSEYRVKWKPGPLDVRPRFVAPHQPRLAWQFWFAALERRYHPRSRNAGWFASLIEKLLAGDPATHRYFVDPPFRPDAPPAYVRAKLYLYEFTGIEERRETGNWWRRREAGFYLPAVGEGRH